MPASRGVKRTASKASASTASSASTAHKNKKKRGVQLELPSAPRKLGVVLACGQGDVGQLGLGEDVIETTKFKYVSILGNNIVDICAGGMHTVALDSNGKVWSFGCNDEGALGRATSGEAEEGKPGAIKLPEKAVAISAGDSHSAALLNNGNVYAWGSFRDSHGSMGLVVRGREGKPCKEPVHVDIGEPAVAIASGGDHLVILSNTGGVYTMGCGEQGQLGRLAQRSASREARSGFSALLVPSKVTIKGGASRIWAGYHATFALDATTDRMLAWGLNNYGQLGISGEKRKTAIYQPLECDAFTRCNVTWKDVACGQHHTVALDTSGQVYCIGRCEYGRLGLGDRTGDAEGLEPIPKLQNKKCISIAAGISNSFAVTDSGEIFSWGMGSEGQLGTGNSNDCAEPTAGAIVNRVDGHLPIAVSAGGQHTVLLMEDPKAKKDPTPEPEPEPVDEPMEDKEEDEEQEVEEEKPEKKEKPRKRQKKNEEEEESSSSAQSKEVAAESKPQSVNGDKKKEKDAMEVDESDKAEPDKKEENKEPEPPKPEEPAKPVEEPKPAQEEPKPAPVEPKPSTVDPKPATVEPKPATVEPKPATVEPKPATVEPKPESKTEPAVEPSKEPASEPKPQEPEKLEQNDVEMKEINGTPEQPIVEKKVDEVQNSVLTTTA